MLVPAKQIKSLIKDYSIFKFVGAMGAGKTTFIAEICKLLGTDTVSSPTYAIVNTYKSAELGLIFHFDCFRLKNENEAMESGLEELIDSGNPCFIEWGDKIKNLLPNKFVEVKIEQKNTYRTLTIEL